MVQPLSDHLRDAGMGQISEVFDGDAPHHPGGCFAQAWSVAEILRALCEDVHQVAPAGKEMSAATKTAAKRSKTRSNAGTL